jgi:hypothetical protein
VNRLLLVSAAVILLTESHSACKRFGRRLYAIRRRRVLAQLAQQAAVLVKAMVSQGYERLDKHTHPYHEKARYAVLDSPSRSDGHLERVVSSLLLVSATVILLTAAHSACKPVPSAPIMSDAPAPCPCSASLGLVQARVSQRYERFR